MLRRAGACSRNVRNLYVTFIPTTDHFHEIGRPLGGCETGQSKITGGHKLPSYVPVHPLIPHTEFVHSKHIIHTVGPIYSSSDIETKATQLASCYRTSLELAAQNALKHVVRSVRQYSVCL